MGSKLFRIGFGVSLAVFMSVVAFWGSMATLPVVFTAKAETQHGGLGLDPENDPVVFTTNGGLEIRKHEAVVSGTGEITATRTITTNRNYSLVQDLTGFYYFTMGTYSGTIYTHTSTSASYTVTNEPINWIILGRGLSGFSSELSDEVSPAAAAIKNDVNAELREFFSTIDGVIENEDIPDGCVLVLSECLLGSWGFNGGGDGVPNKIYTGDSYTYAAFDYVTDRCYGRYRYSSTSATGTSTDGTLYTRINNMFSVNKDTGAIVSGKNLLNFTAEQAKYVKPQQLYTHWGGAANVHYAETPQTDGGTWYTMFPLAYRAYHTATKQNFCIDDYLPNHNQRIARLIGGTQFFSYSTRTGSSWSDSVSSGSWTIVISYSSVYSAGWLTGFMTGVRPAFVMEFVPDLIG